jgi:hypothetical protein
MGNHSQATQPAHHYVVRHSEHEVRATQSLERAAGADEHPPIPIERLSLSQELRSELAQTERACPRRLDSRTPP